MRVSQITVPFLFDNKMYDTLSIWNLDGSYRCNLEKDKKLYEDAIMTMEASGNNTTHSHADNDGDDDISIEDVSGKNLGAIFDDAEEMDRHLKLLPAANPKPAEVVFFCQVFCRWLLLGLSVPRVRC